MLGIIATFPAVKGLRTDIKMATGKAGIMAVGMVVIEPLQSLAGLS
jgi:hypothetical protein